MSDDPTPTTARRQVGATLRELRRSRGLTPADVRKELGFSASKVSRMESGARAVKESDLRALLALYGAAEAMVRELEDTARAGRRRREPYVDVATTEGDFARFVQSGFLDLERDAEVVREFNSAVIPGLLQTEDYMRAMMIAAAPTDADVREKAIPLRLNRQRRLERPDRYAVVLDEAALLRTIGGAAVMADQLDSLLQRCAARAVDLRVIPLGNGYHPGLNSSFVTLTPATGENLSFVEGVIGFQSLTGDDVVRIEKVWEQLRECAASPRRTRDIVVNHRDRYRLRRTAPPPL